jgi:hypothetical protein
MENAKFGFAGFRDKNFAVKSAYDSFVFFIIFAHLPIIIGYLLGRHLHA